MNQEFEGMKANDVVYFWKDAFLYKATIVGFGGVNQVLLNEDSVWLLKDVEDIVTEHEATTELADFLWE